MSPHISTQSDKINEGYCAIGGVHINGFSRECVCYGLGSALKYLLRGFVAEGDSVQDNPTA